MTPLQLKSKIDAVLTAYPKAQYTLTGKGVIHIFSDGVSKSASFADIQIDVLSGKMWLLEGVSL